MYIAFIFAYDLSACRRRRIETQTIVTLFVTCKISIFPGRNRMRQWPENDRRWDAECVAEKRQLAEKHRRNDWRNSIREWWREIVMVAENSCRVVGNETKKNITLYRIYTRNTAEWKDFTSYVHVYVYVTGIVRKTDNMNTTRQGLILEGRAIETMPFQNILHCTVLYLIWLLNSNVLNVTSP